MFPCTRVSQLSAISWLRQFSGYGVYMCSEKPEGYFIKVAQKSEAYPPTSLLTLRQHMKGKSQWKNLASLNLDTGIFRFFKSGNGLRKSVLCCHLYNSDGVCWSDVSLLIQRASLVNFARFTVEAHWTRSERSDIVTRVQRTYLEAFPKMNYSCRTESLHRSDTGVNMDTDKTWKLIWLLKTWLLQCM